MLLNPPHFSKAERCVWSQHIRLHIEPTRRGLRIVARAVIPHPAPAGRCLFGRMAAQGHARAPDAVGSSYLSPHPSWNISPAGDIWGGCCFSDVWQLALASKHPTRCTPPHGTTPPTMRDQHSTHSDDDVVDRNEDELHEEANEAHDKEPNRGGLCNLGEFCKAQRGRL